MKEKLSHLKPILLLQAALLTSLYVALLIITHLPQSTSPLPSGFSTSVSHQSLIYNETGLAERVENSETQLDEETEFEDEITDNSDPIGDSGIQDPPSDDTYHFPYSLIIKALHAGYKDPVTNAPDVGERIELQNLSGAPLSLAGITLRYHVSTSKQVDLFTFDDGSVMTGEYLLFRYEKSTDSGLADLIYSAYSLPLSGGPLELVYTDDSGEETILDRVCWSGGTDCSKKFNTGDDSLLVRDLLTGKFYKDTDMAYDTHYDPKVLAVILPDPPVDEADNIEQEESDPDSEGSSDTEDSTSVFDSAPRCYALRFSEVYSYYVEDAEEQFIELYNPSDTSVRLDGCTLQYKKKPYSLTGVVIEPDSYYAYYPSGLFTLTKNPTSSNSIYLIDTDESIVDELAYPHGQKSSTSYALFYDETGNILWRQTYAPTPGAENIYQEFRTCEDGKVINPLTGNCIKAASVSSTATAECPAGQYRNPLTNRCKKIETTTSLSDCAEGYERNPETNRCRKITKENEGADYALVPTTRSNNTVFIGLGVVVLLVSLGLIYILLQFRHEIARTARKTRQRLYNVCKNLLSRKVRRNRN